MTDYSPPPPPIDILPDTGHGHAIRSQHKRLTAVEKCTRDTVLMARSTKQAVDAGVKVFALLAVSIIGGAGTLIVTGIQTADRVERIQVDAKDAEDDRRGLHDEVDDVHTAVTALEGEVRSADRRAEGREKRTTMAIDQLTEAVNSRRRR